MEKRYGPTNDAGTVIIEREAQKQIFGELLGGVMWAGILERGPTDELITCVSRKDMLAKTGGYIPDSLLPDANMDYWDHSDGAGIQFLTRITDGSEVKAGLYLWDRSTARNRVIKAEAKNGGGWGGRRDDVVCDLDAVPTDILSEVTVKLPDLYVVLADKWKGGTIKFTETGTSYTIISHTAGDGVDGAVVTVNADATMLTDYGAGSDLEVTLQKDQTDAWGRERKLALEIGDGELYPSTMWSLKIYCNDELVRPYPNLSSDPASDYYFEKIVNEDGANQYVELTDEWTGAATASTRPANHYGAIPTAGITAKELTLADLIVDDSNAGDATIAAFTYGADVVPDRYTLTYQIGTTDWSVTSEKQAHHAFPTATDGVAYVADNPLSIGFTITEGTPSDGDSFVIDVRVLRTDEAIDGYVFPDVDNAPYTKFRITDNEESTVTIATGDLTDDGAVADNYRLQYRQELEQGYDGIAAITEQQFIDAWDKDTALFNQAIGEGYGIIKPGQPGICELSGVDGPTAQAAMAEYARSKNMPGARYEIPSTVTDEALAKAYVNDTLGRNDFVKVIFPSYVYVTDPVLTSRMKLVSATGMVQGREAWEAKNYQGYHKAEAGEHMTLPRIRELPTGKTVLNGEILNPAGLQRIRIKKGNFVIWGARIPSIDPSFTFSNHREQLSYYEQVLATNFDWIIFAINDSEEWPNLLAALKSFFKPEWQPKRALRGDTFKDACKLKIDEENNTDATMAAGDMNADVSLRLADTTENFVISIGKQGIFETTAPA